MRYKGMLSDAFKILSRQIVACELCPRLRTYGREVARMKRRAYLDWEYWGKPVPGFGDPHARVLLIGLAPGAHGSNRTGRMFTGDSSGDFLYRALYETGFASQAESRSREDGLELRDAYITAAARCAPPDNKPLPGELARCRPYLERELDLLRTCEWWWRWAGWRCGPIWEFCAIAGSSKAWPRFRSGIIACTVPRRGCRC